MERSQLLQQIAAERGRQQHVLGWSLDHDDAHSVNDWVAMLARYLGRAADAGEAENVDGYRRRLVQMMAIGLAAVESLDRAVEATATAVCRRCKHGGRLLLDGVCGTCADDLREEAAADEADLGARA